jgi:hypothetical protein
MQLVNDFEAKSKAENTVKRRRERFLLKRIDECINSKFLRIKITKISGQTVLEIYKGKTRRNIHS